MQASRVHRSSISWSGCLWLPGLTSLLLLACQVRDYSPAVRKPQQRAVAGKDPVVQKTAGSDVATMAFSSAGAWSQGGPVATLWRRLLEPWDGSILDGSILDRSILQRYRDLVIREAIAHRRSIGSSVEGRPIDAHWFGRGDEEILLLAAIHGTEPAGMSLLLELGERLHEQPSLLAGRTIVMVPVVNPDGLHAGSRYNAQGVDINRNFPTPNRSDRRRFGSDPLSEPEARALHRLIERQDPARIISIHQPLACIDYDGPAQELAREIEQSGDLEIEDLGSRRGSLGTYAGEVLGIPTITLELRRSDDALSRDELWQRYGDSLITAITFEQAGEIEASAE